ncbi:COG1470 family protein [Chryseobacterium gwangjuense]|uniref:COG1470 family protein n=1 Tax=Chryseobacterium gwangjuense TaxID=1069980 RepID=UPI001E463555|nr:hypothetical protein [Chryseobacterium gwangjuense]MCE3077289.1 hypothetical protein [Chryseobacterium gwangjuense]
MIRKWIIYIILLLFPVLIFSQNQSQEFVNKKDSLLPGTSTSVSFKIENKSQYNKTYILNVETSASFITPILIKDEITVSPFDTRIYIVPLRIATEASAGKYEIALHISEKGNEKEVTEKTEIIVSEHRNLSITLLESPEYIKAGQVIKASFLLKNNGNTKEHLVMESDNALISQVSTLILPSGANRVITIIKNTDPNLGKNDFVNLNLTARSTINPDQAVTAYSSVKIISIRPVEEDIYYRLPVSASLSFIGARNRGNYQDGFQGEIYGKGSLTNKNTSQIEFHAVTKNPIEFNAFTPYEEYFINYKDANLFVHIGDKAYSASYLTEFSRYGRGAELRYDLKKFSIGGFYNHPRFFRDIKDEFNIYSKIKIKKESEITVGYLHKIPLSEKNNFTPANTQFNSNTHLPYVTGKFQLLKNLDASGEITYSKNDEREGTAYMLQTHANFNKISGSLMYLKASPEFAGYFSNTSTFNGNIQYKLLKKVNLFANFIQDAKNYQRDTLLLAAPYRRFFQYGAQYNYIKTGSVMVYGGYQKYQDRLMPRQFDYDEKFVRLSLNQKIGIFTINLEGQLGNTNNFLTGFSGTSSFYTANLGFEKFKTSFNLYGSYAITSRYQLQNQKQTYFGARVLSRLSDKTNFSIFYQNNYMPEDYFKDRNLFEALFHHQLFRNHEIDLSGRYNLQRGDLSNKDFIFSLRYTLRMNAPVQKIAEYTTLSGNISNLGVKKVDGIRLIMGNHITITDKAGNYIFKNVPPGDYFLEIDKSTTQLNDIPYSNFPAALHLIHEENIYNFGLTAAANIQGSILLNENEEKNQYAFAQYQLKKESKKNNNVVVEVTNGEQTYRKICIIGEPFDFTYLRPGSWTLKIYRNGLDKRYKISTDNLQFALKPSETKNVIITIVKQQTEIKYQQEGVKVGYNEIKKQK